VCLKGRVVVGGSVRECLQAARFPGARHLLCWMGAPLLLVFISSSELMALDKTAYRGALLYYANETPAEALSSKNYQTFLRVLNQSDTRSAAEIHGALLEDVSDAAKTSLRDVEALRAAARRTNVGLFVFSNALALQNQYLFFGPLSHSAEVRFFGRAAADDNPLLEFSPLSRPEQLRAALNVTLQQFGQESAAIALIVRSHGSYGIPLMPRVNFDFTKVSESEILRALDEVSHDDLRLPEVRLQGTSQVTFWGILEEVSEMTGAKFPLVFLSSCESGPLTVTEVLSIPRSVSLIIHSGHHGMSSQAISYESMLSDLGQDAVGIDAIVSKLVSGLLNAGQRLRSDTAVTAWRWPFISLLGEFPLWTFGIPLLAWILWSVSKFKSRYRLHSSIRSEGI
jgi:hypothetical protein